MILQLVFLGEERVRNGQSTVGGPTWTKMDLFRPKWTEMDHFGPVWSRECQNSVRNKVILTKMVVWTILDHFGPVHFPTVPRPRPRGCVRLGNGGSVQQPLCGALVCASSSFSGLWIQPPFSLLLCLRAFCSG